MKRGFVKRNQASRIKNEPPVNKNQNITTSTQTKLTTDYLLQNK